MKLRITSLSLLTILCLALRVPAFAGDIYDNGPSNGTSNAYFIDVYAVTDSFTVTSNFTMRDDILLFWVPAGAIPLTVDWSVGTSSFGSDVGSGINTPIGASLVCSSGQPFNGGICGGGFGYDVYNATVNTGNINLSPGTTYWLTATGATDSFGGRDAWDINSGPSLAFHNLLGSVPSESFTIEGTPSSTTPEPSSIMLFGSGILGLAGILRRRLMG
jgi:hypothetical protein